MTQFARRWGHWLALAAVLICFGGYLAFESQSEYVHLEDSERERLLTQSKVIDDNLTRQLTAINLALESIASELPYWASQPDGQLRAMRRLKSMEATMPAVRTFLVLDAQGQVVLSNREELVQRNFMQRDYFQTPARSLDPKTLFVSPPFKSVLNNYLINLSRVVLDAKGQFAGVVSAAVDPVDIEILLNSVRYTDDMRAMLVHGDGKVFVSQPAVTNLVGRDLSEPSSFFSQHMKSGRAVSQYKGIVYSTQDARLPVFRTLQPPHLAMDKALVVVVSRELEAIAATSYRDAPQQLVMYLVLVVFSALALWVYQGQMVRQRANAQRLKLATQTSGVGIWEFDLKTRCYHWDNAMFALFGLASQQVNARNDDWHQLLLPGEFERIKAETIAAIKNRQTFDLTFKVLRPDGEVRFMRNRAGLHNDNSGVLQRLIGSTEDVTERKLKEEALRIAATAFECQESIVVTGPDLVILRVNQAFTEFFGYAAHDAIGLTPKILYSGRHSPAFYADMWTSIHKDGAWQGEVWNRRKNGDVFPVWLSITAVHSEDGAVTHYVGTHIDITQRKLDEDAIRQMAFYDPLTRLPNRRLLQERLKQALTQAKREHHTLALMYLDLDKFKPVNDQYGHQKGDELLEAVAHRLLTCVRESDTVARVGGDEFVLLLPVISNVIDAVLVAEKVHAVLRQTFDLSGAVSVSISSSAGIAIYPEHGVDEAALTQHADAAMYAAKLAGRDRFVVYEANVSNSA